MHVCICGDFDYEHPEDCGVEVGCSHYPALCCRDCLCLSFEQAHPEVVGNPLQRLAEMLDRDPLSTRTRTILARNGVLTLERLMSHSLGTYQQMRGIGFASLREIVHAQQDVAYLSLHSCLHLKPLPEDVWRER